LPLIRIANLTYAYAPTASTSVPALQGIDLQIAAGEYVALIGANGSGKTTLVRHLNALLVPTAGDVWIDGLNTRDRSAVRAIRSLVGMVFQSPADQLVATVVEEDVAFGPENLGIAEDELPQRVRTALEQVGMWPLRHRPPHMLSAGQQQRVAIAGALAMAPRCLVLDEATAMLDPAGRGDVLRVIDALHRDGMTIVAITHHMEEAVGAERVITMHQGKIALDGTPAQIFTAPGLAALGLVPPPAVELAQRLSRRWPTLPPGLLTAEALASALEGMRA
jgi:energy-coupling factor transporter ATPase